MNKLKRVFRFIFNLLDLVKTHRPGFVRLGKDPFIKILGEPWFSGGPMTKFDQLRPLIAAKNLPYSSIFCFSAIYTPLVALRFFKKIGVTILVNQNGVYYPAWYSGDYKKKNKYLLTLNGLANFTFFQSQFALRMYQKWVGPLPKKYSILYNAVDLDKFTPDFSFRTRKKVIVFLDVSKFTEKFWTYTLDVKEDLDRKNLDIEWIFCGRILDEKSFKVLGFDQVFAEKLWNKSGDEIPNILRSADISLHFVYNDVCPNKVLECMASGVFVFGLSAGGSAELIGDSSEKSGGHIFKVAESDSEVFFPEKTVVVQKVSEILMNHNLRTLREKARERAELFDLKLWQKAIINWQTPKVEKSSLTQIEPNA
ncbi:MAG: hypothetical protein AB7F43_00330 [Bacteriovoracia bacterium]